jgi:hypothetical protein
MSEGRLSLLSQFAALVLLFLRKFKADPPGKLIAHAGRPHA